RCGVVGYLVNLTPLLILRSSSLSVLSSSSSSVHSWGWPKTAFSNAVLADGAFTPKTALSKLSLSNLQGLSGDIDIRKLRHNSFALANIASSSPGPAHNSLFAVFAGLFEFPL